MAKTGRRKRGEDSLCWECRNAVPNLEKLCGCSWSLFFIPVEGWDAEPTRINNGNRTDNQALPPSRSYHVFSCPYFEKG